MPTNWNDADVQCPFFHWRDNRNKKICCEGIFDDSSLVLAIQRRSDYDTQLSVFCCGKYKNCEVYRMLIDKYDT